MGSSKINFCSAQLRHNFEWVWVFVCVFLLGVGRWGGGVCSFFNLFLWTGMFTVQFVEREERLQLLVFLFYIRDFSVMV